MKVNPLRPRSVPDDGIVVYPIERMGNQLFQWAAGLAQARRLGCPCYVALGFYTHAPKRRYGLSFALETIDHGMIVADDRAVHRPIFYGLEPMGKIQTVLGRVARDPRIMDKLFVERSFEYDRAVDTISPGTTMIGFFQSWRYFSEIVPEVQDRLRSHRGPSDWYRHMCDEIAPGDGSIILNVRRTDYLLPDVRAYHGLATRAYYENALAHLRALGMSGPVYVMSDALDDVLAEFAGMGDLRPIRPAAGTHPLELILLLARSDALVAANSSFSWWGGLIGDRPDRPVIAPRPWFTVGIDTRDLLLPHWITLDRQDYGMEVGSA